MNHLGGCEDYIEQSELFLFRKGRKQMQKRNFLHVSKQMMRI